MKFIKIPLIKEFETQKQWERVAWKIFIRQLSPTTTTHTGALLELLLTPHERHRILRRAAAIDRLRRGKSYRSITAELSVMPQTISAIKRALREKKYIAYSERSKTERKPFIKDSPHPAKKRKAWQDAKFKWRAKGGSIYF